MSDLSTSGSVTQPQSVHHMRAEVESTNRPTPGPESHTFTCDVVVRVFEGTEEARYHEAVTIHHPRGWMGVAAGFEYDLDDRLFPTFADRAEQVRTLVLREFPTEELISVFLLGTGETQFAE